MKEAEKQLIENEIIAESECAWCESNQQPHSRACHLGERYKQVQDMGGVPTVKASSQKEIFDAAPNDSEG